MVRKSFSLALILTLTITVAFAQQAQPTPSVNRLQQIIAYLASDALEGRRTGTPGANDAAHYIAGEFSLLGLRPGLQMARPARVVKTARNFCNRFRMWRAWSWVKTI